MPIVFDSSETSEELEYTEKKYLPVLYTHDKSGKERMWKIWTEKNTVYRSQGLVEGKKQEYQRTFEGKNIGKVNETSPSQQALQSADTMWIKQIDKGYKPKCKEGKSLLEKIKKETSKTGGHNINSGATMRGGQKKTIKRTVKNMAVPQVEVNIKPMKAGIWELVDNNPRNVAPKVTKYFDFEQGVYVQWKLDGWRCVAREQNDDDTSSIVLTTNNGKQYPWFLSLRKDIAKFIKGKDILDGLDGELYAHSLVDEKGKELDTSSRFSTICSTCGLARSEPHKYEDQICFVIFDLVDLTGKYTQEERFKKLKKLFSSKVSKRIIMCDTKIVHSIDEIIEYHDEVCQMGYEGVVIRSKDCTYTDKRTLKMRKYKNFIDKEYRIVDVKKDKGVDKEHFVWVCVDQKTKTKFKAKPMGTREMKNEWYDNKSDYIGKYLTVKFQEFSEDGVPRFPIGVSIREDQ